jgi:multiple sugar transport system permease protein/cellobiose transport system permease protein
MATQNNNTIFAGRLFYIGSNLIDNFQTVKEANFFRAFLNSFIIAISSTFLTVFFSSMAGFGFAKYDFKNKHVWFQMVLVTMMVPMEVGMVAFVWEMKIFHLSDTLIPLILPNIANAFGVFWMTQYTRDAFPYEIMESGRIDGCSDMGVFLKLAIPIIRPAMFTLSIIAFLNSWNNYLLPMILINDPKNYTVTMAIATMGNMFVADYGARILGVVIGILPIMVIFLAFSNQITEGLAAGAVKG